jgi:ribosomal protein L7Ae-like RNA K-turn-binding protein
MANRAGSNGIDATLYRKEGPWCTAFVDASLGTSAAQEAADRLPESVAHLLSSQQAKPQDIEAMRAAIRPADGSPAPVARFVAVNDGEVLIDELVQGFLAGEPRVECAPFPNLVPLARARGGQFPYVVAEVGRDGGEIRLLHSAVPGVSEERSVAGDPEEAHHARRVPGRYDEPQNRAQTEEIWRRNADELAKHIDEVVRENRARLVVLSGDVKARELVLTQLAEATRAVTTELDQHTRTGGADPEVVAKAVESRVAEVLADDINQLTEKIGNRSSGDHPGAVLGFEEVVAALQRAQAETVIVSEFQDDHSLLALAAEPWLATDESGTPGTEIIGSWPAPEVLLRAVALTDASIRYVPSGVLPSGATIAALLRWPNGSATG